MESTVDINKTKIDITPILIDKHIPGSDVAILFHQVIDSYK